MGSGASVRDVKNGDLQVQGERASGDLSVNAVDGGYGSRLHPSTSPRIASAQSGAKYMEAQEHEVPLDFERFLHNNGTLYNCFSQHGKMVYFDESKGLQPFPKEWEGLGTFDVATDEVPNRIQVMDNIGQHEVTSEQAVAEDNWASGVYIQGKGTVMTNMFEEKANVCKYFDAQSGLWVLLPLQWEMNIDFVSERVKQVMGALPGLVDQKEITAALRQCNYDPDKVISVYLTTFGDVLFQPFAVEQNHSELNFFRSNSEKDSVIEDQTHNLQTEEQEAENQRKSNLAHEALDLSDVVQRLNQRVAELEAEQQDNLEKITALLNHRPPLSPPPTRPASTSAPKPTVDLWKLHQVRRLTRELSRSNRQLRSTVHQTLADIQNQTEEAVGALEELRCLYRMEVLKRRDLNNELLELQGSIQVFCRFRGLSGGHSCLDTASDQELLVHNKGTTKKFRFDKVYPSSTTQEEVFEGVLPIITSCVAGYRVCILAYGQAGSGKTYTITGTKDKPGVNFRSIRELLRICKGGENIAYNLKISMLEIYNDTLNDLLSVNPNGPLEIRTQGKLISVPGLTQIEVKTEDDILEAMEMVDKNRKIGSTKMNKESSRSHLMLTLSVEGTDSVSGKTSCGTLTVCDLAGPKHISKTEAKGQSLVEAAAVNRSLTSLRQVFSALKSNALHVPFRNSKLTHLLQPYLSGDAQCCVFVNVNPDVNHIVETLNTLHFGSTLRQIALGKTAQHINPAKNTKADR